jgi:DNA-binding Lrp family transcriptional regulator
MSRNETDGPKQDLLRRLAFGDGVSINVHCLSRNLNKHRNTVQDRVEEIFEKKLLNPPIFPFMGLYKEYPLLAFVWSQLPYDEKTEAWFKEDPHIFAAFRSRYSEYNTLLILYHKDITSYQLWREQLAVEHKLPLINGSLPPSSTSFFSNQLIVKYDPNAPVSLLEEDLTRTGHAQFDDQEIDNLTLQIIKLLTKGKCIKINENKLSKELGISRKTVINKTRELLNEKWISTPVCRFPNFFTPPGYILAICKLEIKRFKQKFIQSIRNDPHITMAFDIKENMYNILLFGAFQNLTQELDWEIRQGLYHPDVIGHVDIQYFSPKSILDISQTRISLGLIDKKHMHFRV